MLIDPYIERSGRLNGVIIHTESFPGWNSFAALVSHLRFVKEHHKRVLRVAFATDSMAGDLAEVLDSHFVNADVKRFPYHGLEKARKWVAGDSTKSPG